MGSVYYQQSQGSETPSYDQARQIGGQELARILAWDSAEKEISSPGNDAFWSGDQSSRDDARPSLIRRTVTTTTTTTFEPSASGTSSGVSAGAVAGLLGVGVAVGMGVGAALTYKSMKNEQSHPALQEHPRSAFQYAPTAIERLPSERGSCVEVDRVTDRAQHPEKFTILASSQSLAGYHLGYPSEGPANTYALQDRPLELHGPRSVNGTIPRSVISETREPFLLTASEHRSQVGSPARSQVGSQSGSRVGSRAASQVRSQASNYAGSHVGSHYSMISRASTSRPRTEVDAASYVSARSHRSSSIIRPVAVPSAPLQARSIAPSKAGSIASVSTVKGPVALSRCGPSAPSRAGRAASEVSARHVALPKSVVGGGRSTVLDDAESIAPSDSISCIGSRR